MSQTNRLQIDLVRCKILPYYLVMDYGQRTTRRLPYEAYLILGTLDSGGTLHSINASSLSPSPSTFYFADLRATLQGCNRASSVLQIL